MSNEHQKREDAKQFGQMIANVSNLAKSVDNLELTVSHFSDRLDKIALDMGSLLGTQNSLVTLQRQANESTNWINENKEFVKSLREDKKDTKGRLKDFLYSYVIPQIIAAVTLYLVLVWKQQQAINQIISSLK